MGDDQGVSFEDILEMFMESQHWSPDVMRDFQRSQLEQLLRHARANVPFYEQRLDCMFRRDDSIDWNRWDEIPLLTRADVQENRMALLARALPPGHGGWEEHSTSGSTARPITLRIPHLMANAGLASWVRSYRAHGIPDTARFAYVQSLIGEVAADNEEYQIRQYATDNKPRVTMVSRDLSAGRKLEIFAELQTDILIDSPNALEILAHQNDKRSDPVRITWVLGFGMGFTPEQIILIEKSFGTQVLSAYSSKEAGPIAQQCPGSRNYHVNEELVVVERQLSGVSNIIVTPLFQSAQPLIRYVHNDMVRLKQSCGCGYQHLTITTIDGRSEPIFKMPNGVSIVPTMVDITKSEFHKICMSIQLAQTAPASFELRYMADRLATERELGPVRAILHRQLGSDIHLQILKVDFILANPGGKQQRFVREYDLESIQAK